MKAINIKATKIFSEIIKMMKGEQYLKIENDPYMPLTIERIQEEVITGFGVGKLYSLAHYYEQNGDLMQDPEMVFFVVDNMDSDDALSYLRIVPIMYQQADLGISQNSVIIEDSVVKRYHPKLQSEHTDFANHWLDNIKNQGFLKNMEIVPQ